MGCREERIPAVPDCDMALQGSGLRMLKGLEEAERGKGRKLRWRCLGQGYGQLCKSRAFAETAAAALRLHQAPTACGGGRRSSRENHNRGKGKVPNSLSPPHQKLPLRRAACRSGQLRSDDCQGAAGAAALNHALRNKAGKGHPGHPLPCVPLGHLLLQHWVPLVSIRMLLRFELQGAVTPATSLPCAVSALSTHPTARPALLPAQGTLAGAGSGTMVAPAYGATVGPARPHGGHATGASGGGCAARVPSHAPGCSTNQAFSQSRVEAGSCWVQGTFRPESTGTLLMGRGTGRISGDNQGPFGLWLSCLLEELAQLHSHPLPLSFPFPLPLLSPPTLHSVKGTGFILPMPFPLLGRAHGETHVLGLAGMEWQEGRGPQHLAGKPHAHADPCPQTSPPPSLQPCPLGVAGLVAPAHGSWHWVALLGLARLWHPCMGGDGSSLSTGSPPGTAGLDGRELGLCPWGWWHWEAEML